MQIDIHLHPDVFEIVKNGNKNVEVRLYDEKRKKIKVGDELVFLKRPDDIEKIKVKVTDLKVYNNFEELVDNYDMKRLYLPEYTKEMFLTELLRFYSLEEQIQLVYQYHHLSKYQLV